MINKSLEEKMVNDVFSSYKDVDKPNFRFVLERQDWYNGLILNIRSIYCNVNDLTDFNYDISKSIEIDDRQNSKNLYLYLSLVGKYAFLLINNTVFNNNYVNNYQLIKLVYFLQENDIILLSKDELLSRLPICINFDEDSHLSTVLSILFSPGLVLPS